MKPSLLICLFSLIYLSVFSQTTFTKSSEQLSAKNNSGVSMGVADMNGDFHDDIIIMNQSSSLNVEHQIPNADGFLNKQIGNIGSVNNWALVVGDVNNDGLGDVISGGYGGAIFMSKQTGMFSDVNNEPIPNSDFFLQGSNLVDFDNDGWLDYFGCDDNNFSKLYLNDKNGSMTEAWSMLNTYTDPVSDNSGNYGSTWTDFDNDGDLDLYIAKCRLGSDSTTDPRRVNMLLLNENGTFLNSADSFGIDIGWQSWSADFGDIDNDGDFDLVVTNHDAPSAILENDGSGHFTDITDGSGFIVGGQGIQSIMRDVDNDGLIDILIAGEQHDVFMNNGDKTFTKLIDPFGDNQMESFALGDINHDGFVDVYAGYAYLYNNPSNIADALFLNDGNDNNFASFNLIGSASNRSGVGAKLTVFGDWGMQVREVRAGESYGISNSLQIHFGLGDATSIDSMHISWPSGTLGRYYNLDVNQFFYMHEDQSCASTAIDLVVTGETVICSGENTTLSSIDGLSHIWSTGETTKEIQVTQTGLYWAQTMNADGCTIHSNPVYIVVDPEDETPLISIQGNLGLCQGESVTLECELDDSYSWSNGETTQSIVVTEAGDYYVTTPGTCDDFTSEVFTVSVAAPDDFLTENDTIEVQEMATLYAEGDSVNWYADVNETNFLGVGNYYETPILDQTTSFFAEQYIAPVGNDYDLGPDEPIGVNLYSTFNGGLEFTVLQSTILKSVKVFTETPGLRILEIRDMYQVPVHTLSFDFQDFETVVPLNFELEPGEYFFSTNETSNLDVFGGSSPEFQRTFDNALSYPYEIEEIISITQSFFGSDYYYYFYDWKISTSSKLCEGNTKEVLAVVGAVDTDDLLASSTVSVWPNPATEILYLNWSEQDLDIISVDILSINGQNVLEVSEAEWETGSIAISKLQAGIYIINIQSSQGQINKRITVE